MKTLNYEIVYNTITNSYRIWDYRNSCWDYDSGDYCHIYFETRWKLLAKFRIAKNERTHIHYEKRNSWNNYE